MSYFLGNKFRGAFFGALALQKLTAWDRSGEISFDKQEWFAFLNKEIVSVIPRQEKLLNIWWKVIFDDFLLVTQKDSNSNSDRLFLLSILPVILYYHDYWHYLSEFVIQTGKQLHKSSREINNILVWCYGVRLALRGELISYNLTKPVVQGTKIKKESLLWLEKLELFFLEDLSFEEILKYLSLIDNKEIALSLFCFLSNPQDFDLTIQQALFLEHDSYGAGALSGVLSGAYNGLTGLPLNWRNLYQNSDFYQQLTIEIEETINEWLGIEQGKHEINTSSVITAPQILQPRSGLQVISQQEYQSRLM